MSGFAGMLSQSKMEYSVKSTGISKIQKKEESPHSRRKINSVKALPVQWLIKRAFTSFGS